MVRNTAIFTMATDRKSYMIYCMVPFSMTLTDPDPDFHNTPVFDAYYLRNDKR